MQNENVKLLWNFSVQTDNVIEHIRRDMRLIIRKLSRVSVERCGDHFIAGKEVEKVLN